MNMEHPWQLIFLFLLGVFFLIYGLGQRRRDKKRAIFFGQKQEISFVFYPKAQSYFRLCLFFCLLGVSLGIIALTKPYIPQPEKLASLLANATALVEDSKAVKVRTGKELIVIVDSSLSMRVKDTRLGGSRLELAKQLMDELIHVLSGEELSLYAFTSDTVQLVPPTYDYLFFKLMGSKLELNEGEAAGTDFLQLFDYLIEKHLGKYKRQSSAVILLSDGGDTRLDTLAGEAKNKEENLLLARAEEFARRGVPFFCIGLGSSRGGEVPNITWQGKPVWSSLEEDLLKKISMKTGGQYFSSSDYSTLYLAQGLKNSLHAVQSVSQEESVDVHTKQEQKVKLLEKQSRFYLERYFLFLALVSIMAFYLLEEQKAW